ncbi:amidohydrolase family protein [Pusillimonas noertemannii]|uniref:Aminocarboxymuconate-semialdehyde decarboxylase n=1 Tax=Pusillimonas noertemannii TaxID=305977 RepID=A0A2U1CKJ7_9BURK|nr:amidohydrolase family protein [Pusillimonas noertemannii]NYT69073.1 amidohydrolase [Pusillimonas noertemannii]PVY61540.1 aminocarboxymuconate-semialdehyde decarboxylase [Pusillimonas noertemannii]TFL09489.1 amidohydrolase [Pusillimonas noertemannii]
MSDSSNKAAGCGCASCTAFRAVDIHAHFYPQAYIDLVKSEGGAAGAEFLDLGGFPALKAGPLFTGPINEKFVNLDLRIADMDATGVTQQMLSLTQPMVYWADAPLADRLSNVFNDALAQAHEKAPTRLFGFATLPMQFPDLAIAEARRVSKISGIKGVYLGTAVNDTNLSDSSFWPVYEVLEELGLPIFLHPLKVIGMQDRLSQYFLANLLGNPFDTAIAAAHLVFSGVMDRFPKLEVVLPHGGGALPFLLGRIAHGWSVRPECAHLERSPREYAARFYYDTVTHDPEALAFLIEQVGASRVMLGSDYCFDMGVAAPVAPVESLASLSGSQKDQILSGNAKRLLRL